MGANVSKSTQSVLMEQTTNIVNNVLTTFKTKNINKIDASQTINVIVSGTVKCKGDLNLIQSSNVTFSAVMNASNSDKTEMSNQITQQLTAAVTNMIQQENSGINLGQANVNWSDSNVQQKVATGISTAFNTTIENTLKNDANNKQVINFYVGNVDADGDCTFSQEQQTKMLSQMIAQNISNNLISNITDTSMGVTSSNEVKQTNAGLNWPWIGGGIFGVVGFCIFAFIIFKVMKKKNGG
jgi:hypothetical protein